MRKLIAWKSKFERDCVNLRGWTKAEMKWEVATVKELLLSVHLNQEEADFKTLDLMIIGQVDHFHQQGNPFIFKTKNKLTSRRYIQLRWQIIEKNLEKVAEGAAINLWGYLFLQIEEWWNKNNKRHLESTSIRARRNSIQVINLSTALDKAVVIMRNTKTINRKVLLSKMDKSR